jgi:hypothetical protein
MRRSRSLTMGAVGVLLGSLVSLPPGAQWLNHRTTGIPRNADGTPKLDAPWPFRCSASYLATDPYAGNTEKSE